MFHMLTCFDLADDTDIATFGRAWQVFIEHMRASDLVAASSAIARRQTDTGLDTDTERSHGYSVTMHFRDRAQADAAWDHIEPREQPAESFHRQVLRLVRDPVFTCWQDIDA